MGRRVVDERETLPLRLLVPSVVPNSTSTVLLVVEVVWDVSSFSPALNTAPVLVAIVLLPNLVSTALLVVEAIGDVTSLLSIVLPVVEVGNDSSSLILVVEVGDNSASLLSIVEVRDDSSSLPPETFRSPSVDV
ncbi:hypothetical protein Adt_39631 [Abeliophyllum distichum]|uniref:Uncharacterized protein n=1 Tax=Abeliophyllum distichum TaxID=126358 RepID=A0ABD1Q5M8_9LAMI